MSGFVIIIAVTAYGPFHTYTWIVYCIYVCIYALSNPLLFSITCLLSVPCPLYLYLCLCLCLLWLSCLFYLHLLWLIIFAVCALFTSYVTCLLCLYLYCPFYLYFQWLALSTTSIVYFVYVLYAFSVICDSSVLFIFFVVCLLYLCLDCLLRWRLLFFMAYLLSMAYPLDLYLCLL